MTDYKGVRQAWIDGANSINPNYVAPVKAAWDAVGVGGDPIVPMATSAESFEDSMSLPGGWSTSIVSGEAISGEPTISGEPWAVTNSTGALGSRSLMSGVIGYNSSTAVSWSGITDAGNMTFYFRTSSEAGYDNLTFFIDGVQRQTWSGLNPWSFYSDSVTSG